MLKDPFYFRLVDGLHLAEHVGLVLGLLFANLPLVLDHLLLPLKQRLLPQIGLRSVGQDLVLLLLLQILTLSEYSLSLLLLGFSPILHLLLPVSPLFLELLHLVLAELFLLLEVLPLLLNRLFRLLFRLLYLPLLLLSFSHRLLRHQSILFLDNLLPHLIPSLQFVSSLGQHVFLFFCFLLQGLLVQENLLRFHHFLILFFLLSLDVLKFLLAFGLNLSSHKLVVSFLLYFLLLFLSFVSHLYILFFLLFLQLLQSKYLSLLPLFLLLD